jgi:hypothetical protein
MKPGSATAHSNHDESLVVRLYGNDVRPDERSRALDLLSGCEKCAALFADLGSIASAAAALPVPSRPRDFTLTPADAARLRPAGPVHRRSTWRGLTRQLGGAFAALGLAGVLVSGALTALVPASSLTQSAADRNTELAAYGALNAAGAVPGASAAPFAAGTSSGAAGAPSSSTAVTSPGTVSGQTPAPSSDNFKAVAGTPTPVQSDSQTGAIERTGTTANPSPQGAGAQTASVGQPPAGGSFDPRLAVLIGSAGLLLVGLLLLLVGPRLGARRVRD